MNPDKPDSIDDGQTHTFTYEQGLGEPTTTINEAISWLNGKDMLDLKPITYGINPDALEVMFSDSAKARDFYRSSRTHSNPDVQTTFEYEGCVITVGPDRFTVKRRE